ncbi:MAG: outer membrane beta-barrel protein [Bacteroidales bacterium]|nr:outer membrane beta-barrel protein [Bacteroidales bacterium]
MKKIKIILAIAAFLLGGTVASAQSDWTAGVGYATTSFRGADCSGFLTSHPLRGFYAGVSHDFYFSALAGLTVEPGAYFYYQSGQNDSGLTPKFIKMHYLSIPVNVKYTFELVQGTLNASVFTGPVLNVGLIGNLYENGQFVTSTDLQEPMRRLTRVNAQWDFGLAVTVAGAVQIRVGYALGLSRLVPEQNVQSNTFSVGAGLLF